MLLGLVISPDPAALPDCGAGSGATIADPRAPIAPTCWHRSDHSSACDASAHPSSADWPPALDVRNRRCVPAPMAMRVESRTGAVTVVSRWLVDFAFAAPPQPGLAWFCFLLPLI